MSFLHKFRPAHETHVLLLTLLAASPAAAVAIWLVWSEYHSPTVRWTLSLLILGSAWWGAVSIKDRVALPLRTLSNLLEAMREGDYSIRGRSKSLAESTQDGSASSHSQDALSDVMHQVNAMAATLRAQRLGALEATTLLRKVMEEIDVAVFAFDGEHRLRLVNRAGEKLLGKPSARILAAGAAELGLEEYLTAEDTRTVQRTFPSGAAGRWEVTRSGFREGGLPHQLLVVSDLTRALREEELKAWQRLVRVLGHELNNSLAPIKSIAGSLETLIAREPLPGDWREDTRRGLSIIASRSDGLSRFMGAYTLLAKLPPPQFSSMSVGDWIRQAASLEQRVAVTVEMGPDVMILGDRAQLEQVLINLMRNAADASIESATPELADSSSVTHRAHIRVRWNRAANNVDVIVEDEGPGLSNTANLFVPFFTTKPGGSGIGLVLSRQIAEAHGGSLVLQNRTDRLGCAAKMSLPVGEVRGGAASS